MINDNLYESFNSKIKKLEEEYIWKHYSSFYQDKDKEIKEIFKRINNHNQIEFFEKEKETFLSKFHKLSLTKGGFISIENSTFSVPIVPYISIIPFSLITNDVTS